MKLTRPALLVAAVLALAACKGQKQAADQRTAVGEVLPGSTSDAMLPYDSLRSQPPLAPNTGSSGAAKSKGVATAAAPDGVASDDAAAVPAEPEPAGTPDTANP